MTRTSRYSESMLGTILRRLFSRGGAKLPATGVPAPAFSLLDHHGERVSSTDLVGKRYVLWFYPKADTPG